MTKVPDSNASGQADAGDAGRSVDASNPLGTGVEVSELSGLWAVVVNWNGGDTNLQCVQSLLEAGLPQHRIVFVDNGSVDGSCNRVIERFRGLAIIVNESNLGFGEGANQGARHALEQGAQQVLFVNNDLRVEASTLLALIAELHSDSEVGVVGPLVLYDDGSLRIWCAGGWLDYRQNLSTLIGHGRPDHEDYRKNVDVDYVAGCSIMVRRDVFERIGLLRADYFAYMEDVEFCLRARLAGYRVRTIGEVRAWHAPSSSTGGGYSPRRKYMQGVNSVHFLRQYATWREWLRFVLFDIASLPLLLIIAPFQGRVRGVLAKASGISTGLRGQWVKADELKARGHWLW
ncbi:MAG: GT2 family glycosyltransferase [Planctomycetota bacterium]|jgi:GT2 family glycosyltransferase